MQRALDAVRNLSEASSLEELTPGYQALREAMDALAGRFSPEELDAAEQKVVKLMKGPDGAPVELPFGEEEQG